MPDIRAISLWQPYASLIAAGVKKHETRHWRYPAAAEGQRVAIHAAKRPPYDTDDEVRRICREVFGDDWVDVLPYGAFVCVATLAGAFIASIHRSDALDYICGDWGPHRYAWKLTDVRLLAEPVPAMGHQSLWRIPSELVGE